MTDPKPVTIPGVVKHIPHFDISILRLDKKYDAKASVYILESGYAKVLIVGGGKPYIELTLPAEVFDMLRDGAPDGPSEEAQG